MDTEIERKTNGGEGGVKGTNREEKKTVTDKATGK